jgi:hypothetical protein
VPVLRRSLLSVAAILTVAGAVVAGLTTSATAASQPHPAATRQAPGLHVHLSGAALTTAADQCAVWASNAGFANNGYMGGSLTTAVAIAVVESGCNPAACFDNTKKAACTEKTETPGDAIDRGAWQLDNQTWKSISDSCAYSGQCAADASYLTVSQDGTFFAPWSTYSSDYFATVLWAAQLAVNGLHAGTVVSAVTGSCLGFASGRNLAPARLANCSENGSQIWRLVGGSIRTAGGLCLAATSSRHAANVEIARCSTSALQRWQAGADAQLYNSGAHRCLADPLWGKPGGDKPGIVLMTTSCSVSQGEGWFKP